MPHSVTRCHAPCHTPAADCKFAQQGLARLAKKRSDFKKKEREMFGGKLAKRAAAAAAAAPSKAEPPAVKAPPPAPAGDPDAAATAGTGASAPAPAEESGTGGLSGSAR